MAYKHKLWGTVWNRTDYLIEWASIFVILLYLTYTLYAYTILPDEIPIHFNFTGEADKYDSNNSIFIVLAIGITLYIGLTFLQHYSSEYNYPIIRNEKNKDRLEFLSLRLMRWIKLLCCILFIIITKSFFAGDQLRMEEFVMLLITVILILVLPLYYIWKMSLLKR